MTEPAINIEDYLPAPLPQQVEIALVIATQAHQGQTDKAGVSYLYHPLTVASLVEGDDAKAVALLHDVIEDSEVTSQDLLEAGLSSEIVDAVQLLTKSRRLSYQDYLAALKGNDLARRVKIADLTHNLDASRLNRDLTDADLKRLAKYRAALEFLSE